MAGFDNDVMFAERSDVGEHPNSSSADNSTEFDRSGSAVTSIVYNSSNTADSSAIQEVKVEGTSSGDTYFKATIGTSHSFAMGVDPSVGNVYYCTYRADANASPSNFTLLPIRWGDNGSGKGVVSMRSAASIASEGEKSGGDVFLNIQNVETAASSNAYLNIQVANEVAPGGNAYITWTGPSNNWFQGVDKSDSNSFKIQQNITSTFPSATTYQKITANGDVTFPSTAGFLAYLASTDNNVTGDGTVFVFGTGNALTEVVDRNNHFNGATGVFTAPVTGLYYFAASCVLAELGAGHTRTTFNLVTTAGTYSFFQGNAAAMRDNLNFLTLNGSMLVNMTANDQAYFTIVVANSTKTVDILAVNRQTAFSGILVA